MPDRDITNAGAVLSIDLDAVCDNWRTLRKRLHKAECAAVVKADAYGLGAQKVAPALYRAGCRSFFVAHLNEALALRQALPEAATVYVLHGAHPGAEAEFVAHRLVPVLNSLPQLAAWQKLGVMHGKALPAILQIDTGMARLGLAADELEQVAAVPAVLQGIDLKFVISHLACAEERDNPANGEQLARFRAALARLPKARASLANSSGIFLGGDYHFDLVRPGAALYGVAPVAGEKNPLRPVIRLQGKILQIRSIAAGSGVGYNHRWRAATAARIATVAVGYADGYLRSLSNRGFVHVDGVPLPIVGNVSMDTITVDVSALPEACLGEGTLVDLVDPEQGVDAVAARAGTIGYEILTSLGNRYARRYRGDAGAWNAAEAA